ncbi:MAG: hypothetical protein JNL70_09360 [Saprospiraceae bacterium]|nr:hypothetical protein [Saprospiraceae bacterium]
MEKIDVAVIKLKTDIFDTVNQYVKLKKIGNKYIGLCPFHDEKTPSFYITPSKGIFKCFGCGKGGDVIKFIQEIKGLSFIEAVKTLTNERTIDEKWRLSDEYKKILPPPSVKKVEFIDPTIVRQTMQRYEDNHFAQFLLQILHNDKQVWADLIQRFSIGTVKGNKTVFWQRDVNGDYRGGQIMLYNLATGKREKYWSNGNKRRPEWTHEKPYLNIPNFQLAQCFCGEYQLKTQFKPVAVVESAKTAAIMTVIEPRYTWLASCGADGLTNEKCTVLIGKRIVLYPDLGKFDEWSKRAKELKEALSLDIVVCDILENHISALPNEVKAQHIKEGLDIADYTIKEDLYGQILQKRRTPLSKEQTVLNAMIDKQPLVANLIRTFNLVSTTTLQPYSLP